jgi:elongation factor Ts
MTVISMEMIQKVREATSAGMMDCKKALTESNGDFDAAVDWLRKKGIASAAKKASRVAAEGLVTVVTQGNKGIALEVNCETDFVAKNEEFQKFCAAAAQQALDKNTTDFDAIQVGGKAAKETLAELVGKIGENMSMRRAEILQVSQGAVVGYLHNAVNDKSGKIGVMVALESTAAADKLTDLGRKIAMHIAAARPEALDRTQVDTSKLERERAVLVDQARASGKPENIIEKMVEGRLNKYYEEVVLLEQIFVMDGENKISAVVEAAAKEAGAPITLKGFTRFGLGEGIEKNQGDFAAEVAAMAR